MFAEHRGKTTSASLSDSSARAPRMPAHLQEIDTVRIERRDRLLQVLPRPLRERRLVVGQLIDSGPDVLVGRPQHAVVPDTITHIVRSAAPTRSSPRQDAPEDPEDLVNLRVAREEGLPHRHLGKDAADRPHVDRSAVVARTEEDFGGAVPERDDLGGRGVGEPGQGTATASAKRRRTYLVGVRAERNAERARQTKV